MGASFAVGLAFLADLAQRRSIASSSLLFLMLVDEIEGLVFVAVGIVAGRVDLFLASQEVLFPAIVVFSAVVTAVRFWRQREPEAPVEPVEPVELAVLSQRIGVAG